MKAKSIPSNLPSSRVKVPERCVYCDAPAVARRGTRIKKLETVGLYRCGSCRRTFTPGPRATRNKTYPIHEIIDGISLSNLGYSLSETAERLSSRHGHTVHPTTISRWVNQHPALTTYRRLRDAGRKRFHPTRLLTTVKLYHRQVYELCWHRYKLDAMCVGELDTTLRPSPTLDALANFIEKLPTACPHELFTREDGVRGSQTAGDFLDLEKLIVTERQNTATETAALIIPTVGSNHQRHSRLQRFMIVNDSSTIAVEVPIWLDESAISTLEARYAVTIIPKTLKDPSSPGKGHKPRHLTGHIDFLQIRNGALHILDYKPDARTNRPIAQLTIYALALTYLVPGLRLFDIKCAWFNERCYNEFFPRKLLPPASRH